jgi:arsenate reductase
MATIYHNARCSKSRGALEILEQRQIAHQVVDYCAAPPSVAELERLRKLLGVPVLEMIRTGDALFTELGLKTTDQRSEREWFELVVKTPLLLQRPIVVVGDRAVIARPSERVLELL